MGRQSRVLNTLLTRFSASEAGSVLASTALLLPLMAAAALFALDHFTVASKRASLQRAADAAAIGAARELHFIEAVDHKTKQDKALSDIARSYARQKFPGAQIEASAEAEGDTLVNVELSLTVESVLSGFFGTGKTLTAKATAEVYGGQNICIISAETGKNNPGIALEDQAEIKAGECGIYSNSQQPHSIRVDGGARIDAQFICSAGGYEGSDGSFSTAVSTDCPQIKDPLDGRTPPAVGSCDPSFPTAIGDGETVNLTPGTYCNGLEISGTANVWFAPGIYVFQNGPLIIKDTATANGENVGLFFDDAASFFEFRDSADISFSAPITGDMTGIVISARKMCATSSCLSPRLFTITSANVRSLLGTINLPQDDLLIDTTMPVSEEAAFTILIIDNLMMKQAPALVLNTDYSATTVPVPEGFAGRPALRIIK